jgi:hypothetical protein
MGSVEKLSLEEKAPRKYERIPFGKEMAKQFLFSPSFKNMNHGKPCSTQSI